MKGLIDSTLREGAQTVGTVFSFEQKLAIVSQLCKTGVEEIELGVASTLDPDLALLMQECRRFSSTTRLALWSRCRADDIDYGVKLAPDVLSLSIPGSDLHIQKKLNQSRQWVLETISSSILKAKEAGITYISLGIEDATRTDQSFLFEIISTAEKSGAQRIRLADTVGIATPAEISRLVGAIKDNFSVAVGVHCHNDFGMATANSLSALEAGTDWADVTVYGLGERAGNARLEELAGFLALKRGRQYNLAAIKNLAYFIAEICKRPIDPHHPLIGEKIFQCETGLHLQGLTKDTETYEPYPPERVGTRRQFLYGAKIGKKEIKKLLPETGLSRTAVELDRLAQKIRNHSLDQGRSFSENEIGRLLLSFA